MLTNGFQLVFLDPCLGIFEKAHACKCNFKSLRPKFANRSSTGAWWALGPHRVTRLHRCRFWRKISGNWKLAANLKQSDSRGVYACGLYGRLLGPNTAVILPPTFSGN